MDPYQYYYQMYQDPAAYYVALASNRGAAPAPAPAAAAAARPPPPPPPLVAYPSPRLTGQAAAPPPPPPAPKEPGSAGWEPMSWDDWGKASKTNEEGGGSGGKKKKKKKKKSKPDQQHQQQSSKKAADAQHQFREAQASWFSASSSRPSASSGPNAAVFSSDMHSFDSWYEGGDDPSRKSKEQEARSRTPASRESSAAPARRTPSATATATAPSSSSTSSVWDNLPFDELKKAVQAVTGATKASSSKLNLLT